MLRAEGETAPDLTAHGLHNLSRGMTQDEWSPGETVVDISVVIDVGDAGAMAGLEEQRVGPHGAPDAAGDAASQRSARTFEALQRTGGLGAYALFTLGGVKRGRVAVPCSPIYLY